MVGAEESDSNISLFSQWRQGQLIGMVTADSNG